MGTDQHVLGKLDARFIAVVFAGLILFGAPAAWAQGKSGIDESRLPPGLSKKEAEQMVKRLDEASAEARRQDEKETKEKLAKLEKETAPLKKRINEVLDKDPQLQKRIKEAERAVRAVDKDKSLSEEERADRLAEIQAEYEPVYAEVLEKAEFDPEAFQQQVEKVVAPPGEAKGLKSRATWYATYSYSTRLVYNPPPPAEVIRTLTAPYVDVIREQQGPGGVRAQRDDPPLYSAYSNTAFVGYYRNQAGLVHFDTVPEGGYTKVYVDAELPDIDYRVQAVALTPSWTNARAGSRFEILADNRVVCQRRVTHASVWTIWGWAGRQGVDGIPISCEFDAPPAGRKIAVRYVAEADVNLTGGAQASSSASEVPREIRIIYER